MSNGIILILVVFYTVAALVIYHKVFTVYYFGSFTNNLFKELFGAFLVGALLAGVTLYLWWLAALIIILAGVAFAGKTENPQAKKIILGAFVVMAIIVVIVGIGFKRQLRENREKKQEDSQEYQEDNYHEESYNDESYNNTDYSTANESIEYEPEESYDIASDELTDSIRTYYSMKYRTDNVAAEIDNEDLNTVTFRLYDPYATTTSDTLGFYTYDKNTETWTDSISGEIVDLETSDTSNEMIGSQSSDAYAEGIIPYSSDTVLSESDLDGLSAQELTYARNEIYARHGYIFNSSELNEYFNNQSWYIPDESFSGTLEGIEQRNATFISKYQVDNGLEYKPQ